MIFSVDGVQWNIGCTVKRVSEMQASEISGMLLDKSYFNDVIGTFLKYDIQLAVPFGRINIYNQLYEVLTEPVDGHTFVLPYAGGVVTVTGRVTSISDVYVRMPNNEVHWKGIQFSVISNHPTKTLELDEVISRGFAPLPDEASVNVGATYQYSSGGWTELDDAEDSYY